MFGGLDSTSFKIKYKQIDLRDRAPPSRFIVPRKLAQPLESILNAWRCLQGNFDYEIVPMGPGGEWNLTNGLTVRAFKTDHALVTPCATGARSPSRSSRACPGG